MVNLIKNWNKSYKKFENCLIYPNEEVVRFVANHINTKKKLNYNKKLLDFGCGAGRHLKFSIENSFYTIGLEVSDVALKQAKHFLDLNKFRKNTYKLIKTSDSVIPLKNNSIDYLIADGVLDSMMTEDILVSIDEFFRIIKNNGLIYISLMSDKTIRRGKFLNKFDQLISESHENKTVQSYFNYKRIKKLFKNFKIVELYTMYKTLNNKIVNGRHSLILKVVK
jgi:SAM-dependent methyltransferase